MTSALKPPPGDPHSPSDPAFRVPAPGSPAAPVSPPSPSATPSAVRAAAPAGEDPTLSAVVKSPPGPVRVDPYLGKTLEGRYVVERVLGEGGMGVVYAGRHKVIDKRVAIKVLRGEMAADQDLTARFLQEARAASAIGNPHIVDISDFGQMEDGATYFVMELLDGKSLSAVLHEAHGPVPVARLCSIGKQIAQGLAAAHAANIVHRDLKPDNVMLVDRGAERDFVKVLDFGIAKVGGGSVKATRAGSVFGTPHYMSPEQAAGAPVDHRTDIYALGVILYEMASGKVPFDADNFMGILTQHMYKAPVPIRALVPEVNVPPGLEAVVLKCLTKKPEGRYETMGELLLELEKLERGLMPNAVSEMMARSGGFNVPTDYYRSAMPAPVPASPALPRVRWPLYAVFAAAMALVGIAIAVLVRSSVSSGQTPSFPPVAASQPDAKPALPAASLNPVPATSIQAAAVNAAHEVLVSVVPADAHIAEGDRDLGTPPVALLVPENGAVTLVLDRRGYKARSVRVDATQPKWSFALDPLPVAQPLRGAAAPPKPSPAPNPVPTPSFGGIDDVGDPFKH